MKLLATVFILSLSAAVASEPAARLSSPVLGYVFDSSARTVRPIAGVPGAATVEAGLPSASKLKIGFVSPNREWLLAVLLDGGVELTHLQSGKTSVLEGAPDDILLGEWSSDSAAFGLWSKAGVLQVWGGLDGSPAVRFTHSLEAAAGLAVADGGTASLVWTDNGLYEADAEGPQHLLNGSIRAAAYRPGSSDWAAIAGDQLLRPAVEARSLSVESPTSLAFTSTGVLIAGRTGVEAISESGATLTPCECQPSVLAPLAGTNTFRLTGLDSGTLAMFDGSGPETRIFYIPTAGVRQ
jgi:hypothetical protein